MSRIRLDVSEKSVLVVCTCGYRTIRLNKAEAHSAAVTHENNCHPENRQAFYAAHKFMTRRAGAKCPQKD